VKTDVICKRSEKEKINIQGENVLEYLYFLLNFFVANCLRRKASAADTK
jgi:hypothetical protein